MQLRRVALPAGLLVTLLALASPIVLCFAFFLEAPVPTPQRVLTQLGVIALTAGIALHVLGGLRRRIDSNWGHR